MFERKEPRCRGKMHITNERAKLTCDQAFFFAKAKKPEFLITDWYELSSPSNIVLQSEKEVQA